MDESLSPTLTVYPCSIGGEREADELRGLPGLVADGVGTRSFLDQQALVDSPYGKRRHYWKGHFVSALPEELIDELLARLAALGHPPGGILIESLHGRPQGPGRATRRRITPTC